MVIPPAHGCYNFIVMRWLCILAVVLPLSQQPPEAPKDKGATESNRAHSAGHAKATTADQQAPTQSTPVVTQTPVATESQQSTAATDKRAGTNGQQRSDEDRSTQRKLILFTGVLAVVGILQLVVMFLTCLIYKRQAREMRRQRHEMRQQRHVMWQQWKAMGQQLAQMQAGGEQTNALIEQAKKQVTELHDTA